MKTRWQSIPKLPVVLNPISGGGEFSPSLGKKLKFWKICIGRRPKACAFVTFSFYPFDMFLPNLGSIPVPGKKMVTSANFRTTYDVIRRCLGHSIIVPSFKSKRQWFSFTEVSITPGYVLFVCYEPEIIVSRLLLSWRVSLHSKCLAFSHLHHLIGDVTQEASVSELKKKLVFFYWFSRSGTTTTRGGTVLSEVHFFGHEQNITTHTQTFNIEQD